MGRTGSQSRSVFEEGSLNKGGDQAKNEDSKRQESRENRTTPFWGYPLKLPLYSLSDIYRLPIGGVGNVLFAQPFCYPFALTVFSTVLCERSGLQCEFQDFQLKRGSKKRRRRFTEYNLRLLPRCLHALGGRP